MAGTQCGNWYGFPEQQSGAVQGNSELPKGSSQLMGLGRLEVREEDV